MIPTIVLSAVTVIILILLKIFLFLGIYPWNDGPYIVSAKDACRSVRICWTTGKRKKSVIRWGTSRGSMNMSVTDRKRRFHSVVLENLVPGIIYYYRIEENLKYSGFEQIHSFTVCRNGKNGSPKAVVMGDLQPRDFPTFKSNRIAALQAEKENPDFIIQTGDNVQIGTSAKSWHYLMASLPAAASGIPFLPSIGNHERYILHSSRNFRKFFPMDYSDPRGAYYSTDMEGMHFIFLDPFDGGFSWMNSWFSRRQKRWLVEDLGRAVEKKSEWIFVVLHQPVFTSGEYKNDVRMRNWLLPILFEYDVDAVFFGHSHLYEHWLYRYGENGYLLRRKDKPGKNPIHFFCIGSSGARLESRFKIFSHPPFKLKKETWYNHTTGEKKVFRHYQYPWNRQVSYDETAPDPKYYHYPFDETGKEISNPKRSYSTSNSWFGFRYGEISLHYAAISISGGKCIISVHYPDGTLMKGFNGLQPQRFILERKTRIPETPTQQ